MPRFARWAILAACASAACGGDAGVSSSTVDRPHPVVVASPDAADADTTAADTTGTADTATAPDTATDAADATVAPDIADTTDTTDTTVVADTAADATTATPFPFERDGDTRTTTRSQWDRYACAPDTDESGPEDVYTLQIDHMGILRARLDDVAGDQVDLDVHLLSAADPAACVRRDNVQLAWVVRPGTWTIAVDTWVGGDGVARVGPYHLSVDFLPLDVGACALDDVSQRMVWSACADGPNRIDCSDDGTTRRLRVPSLGPVVEEAHLVTTGEDFPGDGWPTAARDQIDRHYQLSQAASGYAVARDQPWAPEGEGGSHWGGGATGQKIPRLDEAWYVNMYWKDRPAGGRRVLVVEPWSGRAVVAAGGWETGPGSNTAIGGACEEIHHTLGTQHRDDLVMGFLSDDALPLGPISCW